MRTVSVVYATKTQHSKKLAGAIAQAFGLEAKDIEKHPQPEKTGLLFLVGAIYGGKCNPVILSYIATLDSTLVEKVALVTSSVSQRSRSQKEVRELLVQKGIDVIEEIPCTGGFLLVKSSHPDKADIQCVTEKAKKIAEPFMT
jgi:hypothetical protein